jgi:isopenicillin-N N-acyltransferase-like protein
MASPIPVLDLTGSPEECGFAHGRAMAQPVRANIAIYLARFAASGMEAGEALEEGERWRQAIERSNQRYYAEMVGISEGSGVSIQKVALLNARYEIAFTLYGRDAKAFDNRIAVEDGCTTYGVLPERTSDGTTWLCQNWDWLEAIGDNILITRVRRPDSPAFIALTEAGIVGGKMGLNECGIGLVENGLASDLDGANPYENPFHTRCREILEATSFDQAILAVIRTRRTASANFVIGHAEGEILGLETSPDHVSYYYPSNGIITHSNHFVFPGHGRSQMERIGPSTIMRAKRAERILDAARSAVGTEEIERVANDHFCHPNGICRHPNEQVAQEKRTATLAAVRLNLPGRVMHAVRGRPCEGSFTAYRL